MTKLIVIKFHRVCFTLILLFSTLGCDQATKIIAQDTLQVLDPIEYLGGFLRLEYAENRGAFLSLGSELDPSLRFWIFIVGVSAFLLVASIYLFTAKINFKNMIAISLILGGGIGNLIDRALYGQVVDFLNVGIGSLRTGIFNVADVAIVAGVIILFLEAFRSPRARPV